MREKGVEVRLGFDDTASLNKAIQGIEKVLLISGVDHNKLQQHKCMDAALKAVVKHIAHTGVLMKNLETSPLKI